LYAAVSDAVATWEFLRHSPRDSADAIWLRLAAVNLSRLHLKLSTVLDVRDPARAGIANDALLGSDYTVSQAIGAAAYAGQCEGLLVPSATGIGESGRDYNVIIFTDNLRSTSVLTLIESKRPNLSL
jgi:hypothetical protein